MQSLGFLKWLERPLTIWKIFGKFGTFLESSGHFSETFRINWRFIEFSLEKSWEIFKVLAKTFLKTPNCATLL